MVKMKKCYGKHNEPDYSIKDTLLFERHSNNSIQPTKPMIYEYECFVLL